MDNTIIFVDSDLNNQQKIESLLKNSAKLLIASSASEAREYLNNEKVDCIIVNQNNLEEKGIELLKSLSTDQTDSLYKILFGSVEDNVELIQALSDDIINIYEENIWDNNKCEEIISRTLNAVDEKKSTEYVSSNLQYMLSELILLHDISKKAIDLKELQFLLEEIIESSKTVMKAEASSILLYNEEENRLYFRVASGEKKSKIETLYVNMGEGIAGWVADNRRPILLEDCYKDKRFNRDFDAKTNFKTKSMICVPMLKNEKLIGVLQVINKKNGLYFTELDLYIFETLASQCAIAIENARLIEKKIEQEAIERELKTAWEIQNNFLPHILPEYPDLDIAAILIPASEVSGDYYNIYKLDDNTSLFFITDVAGKSISASLIVSIICSSLITQLKKDKNNINLIEIVNILNQVLMETTTSDKFATSWIGLYKHDKKELISVNAGHNPPLIFKKDIDSMLMLDKGGLFLGSLEYTYEYETVKLNSGDVIILYTDGITEAMDKNDQEYGDKRFIGLINSLSRTSAQETLDEIISDIHLHVKNAPQSDDLTCVVIKVV